MANFPTLSRAPSYPLSPDGDLEDVVMRSPQASGYEQTRPRSTRARRSFGLSYKNISDADIAALRTFEITTILNGANSFSWTHPITSTVYTVRLAGPIQYERTRSPGVGDVSMKFREV